jgi:hypothetical protein
MKPDPRRPPAVPRLNLPPHAPDSDEEGGASDGGGCGGAATVLVQGGRHSAAAPETAAGAAGPVRPAGAAGCRPLPVPPAGTPRSLQLQHPLAALASLEASTALVRKEAERAQGSVPGTSAGREAPARENVYRQRLRVAAEPATPDPRRPGTVPPLNIAEALNLSASDDDVEDDDADGDGGDGGPPVPPVSLLAGAVPPGLLAAAPPPPAGPAVFAR